MRHFAITAHSMGEELSAYHRRLKGELAQFPEELQLYVRHCGLHDASLRGFQMDQSRSELVLSFYADIFPRDAEHSLSLPEGAGSLSLVYSAVERFEASIVSGWKPDEGIGLHFGDVDHDRLTLLAPGRFSHRILFLSGIVMDVTFGGFRFTEALEFNKSLQATRDGAFSSASRFTSFGPACLSSGVRRPCTLAFSMPYKIHAKGQEASLQCDRGTR